MFTIRVPIEIFVLLSEYGACGSAVCHNYKGSDIWLIITIKFKTEPLPLSPYFYAPLLGTGSAQIIFAMLVHSRVTHDSER